jgi:hypothetical protein
MAVCLSFLVSNCWQLRSSPEVDLEDRLALAIGCLPGLAYPLGWADLEIGLGIVVSVALLI